MWHWWINAHQLYKWDCCGTLYHMDWNTTSLQCIGNKLFVLVILAKPKMNMVRVHFLIFFILDWLIFTDFSFFHKLKLNNQKWTLWMKIGTWCKTCRTLFLLVMLDELFSWSLEESTLYFESVFKQKINHYIWMKASLFQTLLLGLAILVNFMMIFGHENTFIYNQQAFS